jgi:hypothetical protein
MERIGSTPPGEEEHLQCIGALLTVRSAERKHPFSGNQPLLYLVISKKCMKTACYQLEFRNRVY